MKKKVKFISFFVLFILIISSIIVYKSLIFKDDIYVVSKKNLSNEKTHVVENEIKGEDNNHNKVTKDIDKNFQNNKITIYISGAVNRPGIVTIESDKRLYDAVELLGGTTKEADLNGVNLSVRLEDEQHYIIPKIGEATSVTSNDDSNKPNQKNESRGEPKNKSNKNISNESKVNINVATIEELDSLPGVGEATANKILQHREENGQFSSIEEIKNVNGIGDKKYENIKDLICVD
ncbi:helix-hairpin-helix domain-containing protein [Clostridioides difficile]|uniref:helix-hairpin-helix domain-containing protein n=1 Tax=Clostridioides difficile TaxID=1496 RepID=UPI00038C7299|nr:helix-hairpin-helix domain-containing protein [Clostridioides difficile]EQE47811.1 competence ComEA helix-hairpin-helix repeat region domain protein [Clostridioides difficile CD42]EQF26742.1 competence ComEA helix-hairpin-helix repeat region domain protein [Clostridioides difficile CD159]EQF31428.1 competence ComEA helix-hairpin-helix repeat region domain protein [Clostridioides difficile CD165]EQG09695.1 competence ComEA helix-hairpin-helix repeat region domain protein [Clostridioides diffi